MIMEARRLIWQTLSLLTFSLLGPWDICFAPDESPSQPSMPAVEEQTLLKNRLENPDDVDAQAALAKYYKAQNIAAVPAELDDDPNFAFPYFEASIIKVNPL